MKKLKKKDPKFFCESCGSEVPRKSKVCTTCGRFFASVKCPKCGCIGDTDDFKDGCPKCGYAVNKNSENKNTHNIVINNKKTYRTNSSSNLFSLVNLLNNENKTKGFKSDSSLPIWVYIVTLGILLGLVILLYSCL